MLPIILASWNLVPPKFVFPKRKRKRKKSIVLWIQIEIGAPFSCPLPPHAQNFPFLQKSVERNCWKKRRRNFLFLLKFESVFNVIAQADITQSDRPRRQRVSFHFSISSRDSIYGFRSLGLLISFFCFCFFRVGKTSLMNQYPYFT